MQLVINAPWWLVALAIAGALGLGVAIGYITYDVSNGRKYDSKVKEVKPSEKAVSV